jgi:hypothetical protein
LVGRQTIIVNRHAIGRQAKGKKVTGRQATGRQATGRQSQDSYCNGLVSSNTKNKKLRFLST